MAENEPLSGWVILNPFSKGNVERQVTENGPLKAIGHLSVKLHHTWTLEKGEKAYLWMK